MQKLVLSHILIRGAFVNSTHFRASMLLISLAFLLMHEYLLNVCTLTLLKLPMEFAIVQHRQLHISHCFAPAAQLMQTVRAQVHPIFEYTH